MDPITVTATCAGSRLSLVVKVLTGAAASQPGTVINNTVATVAVTPQASGSLIYGLNYFIGSNGGPFSGPSSAATQLINDAWGLAQQEAVSFRSSAKTTAATPVTLGVSAGSESSPVMAMIEILAAGSLAEDPSSPPPLPGPAPANSNLAVVPSSLTTDAFTPPPGSLLLAMAGANNTSGIAISDSAGLTWTQQVSVPVTNMARIWTALVPGTPGPPVLQRYVVDAPGPVTIPAGTLAAPVAFLPGTGGVAGRGNKATASGAGIYPQVLHPGQVLVLDPGGAMYAAITAVVALRPYVPGSDDVGHAGLSN